MSAFPVLYRHHPSSIIGDFLPAKDRTQLQTLGKAWKDKLEYSLSGYKRTDAKIKEKLKSAVPEYPETINKKCTGCKMFMRDVSIVET